MIFLSLTAKSSMGITMSAAASPLLSAAVPNIEVDDGTEEEEEEEEENQLKEGNPGNRYSIHRCQ